MDIRNIDIMLFINTIGIFIILIVVIYILVKIFQKITVGEMNIKILFNQNTEIKEDIKVFKDKSEKNVENINKQIDVLKSDFEFYKRHINK